MSLFSIKNVFIFFILLLLASCDCVQQVSGVVLDKQSGKPVAGIKVYNKNKEWSNTQTDAHGLFKLSNVSGGFRCPPMQIVIEGKNYKVVNMSINAGGRREIFIEKNPIN